MIIYIIVLVTYDWYRFQDNLTANVNKDATLKSAAELAEKHKCIIAYYADNSDEKERFDAEGITHIWVQKIIV